MRSLLLVLALLTGAVLASGCDATDLSARQRATPPVPTSAASDLPGAASSAPGARHKRPHAHTSPTKPTAPAKPSVTAMPTETANAGTDAAKVGVPTSYAEARTRLAALKAAPHSSLSRFTTTGDAVYCVLQDSYLPTSCEVSHGAIRDEGVCGQSMSDSVGRVQLGDDGASPECNTDTIREPGAKVVAAPAVVSRNGVTCAVERIGVTCVGTRTHVGFFLTPGRYATFSH